MRAQMVKEVVPLTEDLVTTFEVAFHDPDSSLGLVVLETEDPEFLGFRDVIVVNVDVVEVDVFPQVNPNIGIVLQTLEELLVTSLAVSIALLLKLHITLKQRVCVTTHSWEWGAILVSVTAKNLQIVHISVGKTRSLNNVLFGFRTRHSFELEARSSKRLEGLDTAVFAQG